MPTPVEPGQCRIVRIHGQVTTVRVLRPSCYVGCWVCRGETDGGFHVVLDQHLRTSGVVADFDEAVGAFDLPPHGAVVCTEHGTH